MQNLYVYRDTASGNTGDVFQCINDAVMRRSVIPSLASIPLAVARDTIVLHIGTIDFDCDNTPILRAVDPRIVLSGASPEVSAARDELMFEAARYGRGGDVDEE